MNSVQYLYKVTLAFILLYFSVVCDEMSSVLLYVSCLSFISCRQLDVASEMSVATCRQPTVVSA